MVDYGSILFHIISKNGSSKFNHKNKIEQKSDI